VPKAFVALALIVGNSESVIALEVARPPIIDEINITVETIGGQVKIVAEVSVISTISNLKTIEISLRRFPQRGALEPNCYGDTSGSILMGSNRDSLTGLQQISGSWQVKSQTSSDQRKRTTYVFERFISDGDNQARSLKYCRGTYGVQQIGMVDDSAAPRDIQINLIRSETGEFTNALMFSRFYDLEPGLTDCKRSAQLSWMFEYCYPLSVSRSQISLTDEIFNKAKAEAEAKAKAEAEAKAKAEAEAKAKAEAEAKAKASSQKSIICVKGKSSLKVIGKNPKCPKGYKKK
jgi:hypothetical protein